MKQQNKITVHLRRSAIGTTPTQRQTLLGLGLIKTGKYKVLNDTASIRGMVKKVIHLIDVVKGEHLPVRTKGKKGYEVILGEASASKATQKSEKKSTKGIETKTSKTAVKKAAKK